MPRIRFTERTLAALPFTKPPATKAQRDYYDSTMQGFGLRIGARTKTFFLRYRTATKQRRIDLGLSPTVPLTEARSQAQAVLNRYDEGRDPVAEAQTARAQTFGALAALYLEKHAMRKKRTWRDDARMIRIELADWYNRPIKSIRRAEVRDLLDEVVARGAPVLANRVLALIRKMLNFALDREWVDTNVAWKMPRPTKETARTRVLSPGELQALWWWLGRPAPETIAIRDRIVAVNAEQWQRSQVLLKLRLLTAQRGAEVLSIRGADLDLEAGWWTIPSNVAKNGLVHRVFLSAPAIALLRPLVRTDATPVFAGILGPRHRRAILVDVPLDNFQPKDLRRTAASLMTAGGVPRDTVKRILNHVERDITAVYDRYSYDPEKRTALTWWADRLDAIVQGRIAKLLPFAPLS